MKKIRIWWLNPVVLYTMLMLLVLFANNMSSIKYSSLFGMKKGIEFKYLLLYALFYVLFVLGYLLSKKYKIKSNIMDDYYKESVNEKAVYQIFNVLFVLYIGAYLIWFCNALRINGARIILYALSGLDKLATYSNYLYLHAGRISGITTFTEFSTLASPMAVYLFMTSKSKKIRRSCMRKFLLMLLFCVARAFLFSERVAIIEMFLPAFIVWLIYQNKIKNQLIISLIPVIGVIALFVAFGVFEYSRSWKAMYSAMYDSYFDFIYTRILGYYCGSINTECLYLKHLGPVYWPHMSMNWLFRFPGFKDLANNGLQEFQYVLRTFGNPEFNNSSGLLAFYSDFGFFGIPLQVIFGYLIGRSYRMFKRENILRIVIYSYVVYSLLELPRFFSFGTLQFFYFMVAVLTFLIMVRRKRIIW